MGVFEAVYANVCSELHLKPFKVIDLNSAELKERLNQNCGPKLYISDIAHGQRALLVKDLVLDKKLLDSFFHSSYASLNITNIKLNNCGIGDAALAGITECTWLKSISKLSLNGNSLSKESLKLLFDTQLFHGLTHLSLNQGGITDEHVKLIAPLLPTNKTLKRIDFWCNKIGDEGLHVLAESLRTNNTLETLVLADNLITDAGAKDLAAILTKPKLEKDEEEKTQKKTRKLTSLPGLSEPPALTPPALGNKLQPPKKEEAAQDPKKKTPAAPLKAPVAAKKGAKVTEEVKESAQEQELEPALNPQEEAAALLKLVPINTSLKCISLQFNRVTVASVEKFIAAIKSFEHEKGPKTALQYINIENNMFDYLNNQKYSELQDLLK